MLVKALRGFAGKISMHKGQIREVEDEIAQDLLKAGHVAEVKVQEAETKKKAAKKTAKN